MTGLFSALSSATAGLRATQANLKLVSDNVARADDPTRTRHSLTNVTDPTGQITGVNYSRRTAQALAAQLNQSIAEEASTDVRDKYLTRVSEALGTHTGTPALLTAMQQFSEAWRGLQTTRIGA